jgi:O-antigen ligase
MLWAEVSWDDRLHALRGFHKLLLIPLLLVHFRRSKRATWVIIGFFVSASVLLVLSWSVRSTPGGLWRQDKTVDPGVPVKDYIAQSSIFALCALGLLGYAVQLWLARRLPLAIITVSVAALFIANLVYVATARTALVVIAVLLLLLAFRQTGWKGTLITGLVGGVTAGFLSISSPYLHERLTRSMAEIKDYRAGNSIASSGLRLKYWKKSVEFVAAAPVIGHGTGTIETLFRRNTTSTTDPFLITGNPHNQILGVAIQLGLMGTIVLVAMWIAHLALFRQYTLVSWLGLVVVVQNIVSSLFNSHLFDFVQGWIYVFGIGILGGAVMGDTRAGPNIRSDPNSS